VATIKKTAQRAAKAKTFHLQKSGLIKLYLAISLLSMPLSVTILMGAEYISFPGQTSIREVLLFPQLRRKKPGEEDGDGRDH